MSEIPRIRRLPIDMLDRYLAGEGTSDDVKTVTAWMAEHPTHAARVERMSAAPIWDVTRAAERMRRDISGPAVPARSRSHRTFGTMASHASLHVWRRPVMLLGVVAAAVLGVGLWVWPHRTNVEGAGFHGAARVYTTRVGERADVVLADGSRITLAPQTTLRVMPEFGASHRTVRLDGEAYLTVMRADKLPFIVQTRTAMVRVLGTVFDVRSHATESNMRVAVVAGKVEVSALTGSRQRITLTAGQVGRVTDSTLAVVSQDDAAQYSAWSTGRFVFHNAPVSDVFATLNRWYGYEFKIADSTLNGESVTLGVSTQSGTAALATLERVLEVEMTFDGRIVTVRRRTETLPTRPNRRGLHDTISTSHTEVGR